MRRAVKILFGVAVLVVALVVAGIAVLKSIDFNSYRGLIAEKTKEATGRELAITGDLKFEVSLAPAIAVEGVTFANAPWGSRKDMVVLKRLAAEIELLPLITGDVRINRLVLQGLDVLAEVDKSGRANWEFQAATTKKDSGGAAQLPAVRKVDLRDIRLAYKDARTGASHNARFERIELAAASPDSPLEGRVNGAYQGVPFDVTGRFGSVAALSRSGERFPLSLRADLLGVSLQLDGHVVDPRAIKALDVRLQAKGDDLAKTMQALAPIVPAAKEWKVPSLGPFNASARLSGSLAKLQVADLKAALGRPGDTHAALEGGVADALAAKGIDLRFSAESKSPTALAAAFGTSLPPLPPVKISMRVRDQGAIYLVEDLAAKAGNSDIAGSTKLDMSGKRPDAVAMLTSPGIDLKELAPPAKKKAPAPKPADGRLFSADPLPVEALRAANADFSLKTARLVLPDGMELKDVEARITLRDGRLSAPLSAVIAGGRVGGDVRLDASRTPPALAVKVDGKDVVLGTLLASMGVTDAIKDGKTEIAVDLRGHGASVRAIMAALNGEARVIVGPGQIHNKAFNRATGDVAIQLLDAVNPLGKTEEYTALRCGVLRLTVKDGLADATDRFAVETQKLNIIGGGKVDLRTEGLDLAARPEVKQGLGISLTDTVAGLVRIQGTLAEPKIGVNPLDAARAALTTGAAIATGGLSVVAKSLFDRTNADPAPCQTALGLKSPPPPAGGKQQPSGTQQAPGGGIGDTLNKGLRGLFGK